MNIQEVAQAVCVIFNIMLQHNVNPAQCRKNITPRKSFNSLWGRDFCDIIPSAIRRIARALVPEIVAQFLGAKRGNKLC